MDNMARRLRIARGDEPADIVIKSGTVLDVFAGDEYRADVAVADGYIAGIGDYDGDDEFDANGLYIAPGFIESHIHIESSMLTPQQFGRAVATRGTTTVVADPHEICNVAGKDGMQFMLRTARRAPMIDIAYMAPSCVPATPLETAGAQLDAGDLSDMLADDGVIGLGEMMNFPAVIGADEAVMAKLRAAHGMIIDGHAPAVTGRKLQAYVAAGIRSDHECTELQEAKQKLRAGQWIMIRHGTAAKNLETLAPLLQTAPAACRCILCSDDRSPEDLLGEGHLDNALRMAVKSGVHPMTALRAVTVNPAQYFGMENRGVVAPGRIADIVLIEDLTAFRAVATMKRGRIIARDGQAVGEPSAGPKDLTSTCELPALTEQALSIKAQEDLEQVRVRVIEIVPGQIVTEQIETTLPVEDGMVQPDADRDIARLVVIERHGKNGNIGAGFVKGLGISNGAMASTVAHDSHNLIMAGYDIADMLAAAERIESMGGGQAVAVGAGCIAELPLPIGGLMSDRPLSEVAAAQKELRQAARKLGTTLPHPFMQLSFLALPVIPHLKLTDRGLVDVESFSHVSAIL